MYTTQRYHVYFQLKLFCWLLRRELIKGIHFHYDWVIPWLSSETVMVGRICLSNQTQNGAKINICGNEMFYVWATFEPELIIVECKLWCQNIDLV